MQHAHKIRPSLDDQQNDARWLQPYNMIHTVDWIIIFNHITATISSTRSKKAKERKRKTESSAKMRYTLTEASMKYLVFIFAPIFYYFHRFWFLLLSDYGTLFIFHRKFVLFFSFHCKIYQHHWDLESTSIHSTWFFLKFSCRKHEHLIKRQSYSLSQDEKR